MTRNNIILKRDGVIFWEGLKIGTWSRRDIWEEKAAKNGRDRSGQKLVHYLWAYELADGHGYNWHYTRGEMAEDIDKYLVDHLGEICEAVRAKENGTKQKTTEEIVNTIKTQNFWQTL